MTKGSDPETLDPVTDDDYATDEPRETVDPVPDRVPSELKPKRKRRPSMKRKAKAQ